jgi:hypothetical protein
VHCRTSSSYYTVVGTSLCPDLACKSSRHTQIWPQFLLQWADHRRARTNRKSGNWAAEKAGGWLSVDRTCCCTEVLRVPRSVSCVRRGSERPASPECAALRRPGSHVLSKPVHRSHAALSHPPSAHCHRLTAVVPGPRAGMWARVRTPAERVYD